MRFALLVSLGLLALVASCAEPSSVKGDSSLLVTQPENRPKSTAEIAEMINHQKNLQDGMTQQIIQECEEKR